MNEKTVRALIQAGAVKRSRIVAQGTRFHVEFDTPNGSFTASTNKDGVRQWRSLDAVARWLRGMGLGSAQLELAKWAPEQKQLAL